MHIVRNIVLLALLLSVGAGPARAALNQHLITGEPILYGVDPLTGELIDRDIIGVNSKGEIAPVPHKNEIIAITVESIFLGALKEARKLGPHVLVYVQVFDDGKDDPATAHTRVLWNEMNQPEESQLGLSDRLLYGPTPFKGYPIRIRLSIVELDKSQKSLVSKLLQATGQIAATSKPEAATAVNVVIGLAEIVNALNEDDFELRYDMTLFPQGPKDQVIRSGKAVNLVGRAALCETSYVIIKRELEQRKYRSKRDGVNRTAISERFDFTQPLVNVYTLEDGTQIESTDRIVTQGGELHWSSQALKAQSESKKSAVEVTAPPQRHEDSQASIEVGERKKYVDRTHVVMDVTLGFPNSIDDEALRSITARDLAIITKSLDNPNQTPMAERLLPSVDALAAAIKAHIAIREVASQAARRSDREKGFRTGVDYLLYWTQQIRTAGLMPDAGEIVRNDSTAFNAVILDTLNDLIVNLPPGLRAGHLGEMQALQGLTKDDIEAVTTTPAANTVSIGNATTATNNPPLPSPTGLFRLKEAAIQKIRAAAS